jgi:hypothetical protein
MNNNLVLVQQYESPLNQRLEELTPTKPTLIQFNQFDSVCVSKYFYKNISIPKIPCFAKLDIPMGYNLVSHVCVTNDFHKKILTQYNIPVQKINLTLTPHNNAIKINHIFDNYYKFGAILNVEEDMSIIQDIISIFYEATKHLENTILFLSIESEKKDEVINTIDRLHKTIGILPSRSKIIFTVTQKIDNNHRMSVINTIDCLLQINSTYISDLEYYFCLLKNKRIIGHHNLDDNYNIELISSSYRMVQSGKVKNFFPQFDHHELYNKFQQIKKTDTIYGYSIIPNNNTSIEKLI